MLSIGDILLPIGDILLLIVWIAGDILPPILRIYSISIAGDILLLIVG